MNAAPPKRDPQGDPDTAALRREAETLHFRLDDLARRLTRLEERISPASLNSLAHAHATATAPKGQA